VDKDGEGGEGCLLVVGFWDFCSSRISVSVRRSIIVWMWWVVVRVMRALGEAVEGRAERKKRAGLRVGGWGAGSFMRSDMSRKLEILSGRCWGDGEAIVVVVVS